MEKIGLRDRILLAAANIDKGRKNLDIDGNEREGRISYHTGLSSAMEVFLEAYAMRDAETFILVEYTLLGQEREFCNPADTFAIASLTKAVQSFDDAFLALEAVSSPAYRAVEQATPHRKEYRFHGMPRDAYHIACESHRARLTNALRTPGTNMTEKVLLQQRLANLPAAQDAYAAQQRSILGDLGSEELAKSA
jgi:hypothetical protein